MRECVRQRVLLVIAAAILTAGAATAAATASVVAFKVSSALGAKIIVTSNGLTLYHDTGETRGAIKCVGACAKLWVPILASAKPQAGPGLSAGKLGTIKRPDGTLQVTYNGLALYHYASDKAGQTKGQGLNGQWFAVTAAGGVTKAKAATGTSSTSPSPASNSNAGTSSGGSTGAPLPTITCNPAVVVTDPNDPCYNTAH